MVLCYNTIVLPDRIFLKNDNIIKGDILLETEELVKISTAGGILEIRKTEIRNIQKEKLFSEFIKKEETIYGAGDLEEIFRNLYSNAKNEDDLELARKSLIEKKQFIYDNIFKNTNRYKSEELEISLKKFIENQKDDEFYYFIFGIFKVIGDTPRATKYCLQINPNFYELHPEERKEILTFLSDTVQSLSKRDELEKAFQLIEYINKIDKNISESLQIIIYLKLAYLELKNGFYEKALNIYIQKVMPISENDAKVKIQEVVRKRIEEFLEEKQYKESEEFFNKYSSYFDENDKKLVLSDILKKYADDLFLTGDVFQAKEVYSEYYKLNDSGETPLVRRCEYEIRLKEIEENDFGERYKLALFCEENKLYDLAKKEFEFVANSNSQWKTNAELHRTVIKKEEELKNFEKIMDVYHSEDFEKVAELSKDYVEKHPESEFITEIREILKISLEKKELEKYKKKSQDILLYQLAEREYLKYNYSKAIEYIDELLKSIPEKNLREKAEFLKYKITQAKSLRELESVDSTQERKTLDIDVIKKIK